MALLAHESLLVEFWDVGQGDCSVIHLNNRDVVVIDVGPRGSPLVPWLLQNRQVHIHSLILTHNDADHIGALSETIDATAGRLRMVYFLQDRPRDDKAFLSLTGRLRAAITRGEVEKVVRLEAPESIWREPVIAAELAVVYPDVLTNIGANAPNRTSAILVFAVAGVGQILWTSDSSLESVARAVPNLNPGHMHGPHHGAPADRRDDRALHWLRSIGPKRVFVSVGSLNSYAHPAPSYLAKVLKSGASVACTQLTPQCETRHRLHHVVPSHALMGLPQPRKGFSCRGHIRLALTDGKFTAADQIDDLHAREIRKLTRPKCIDPIAPAPRRRQRRRSARHRHQ